MKIPHYPSNREADERATATVRKDRKALRYPNVGLMLDTDYLLHTNLSLNSQQEGIAYIHRLLDEHGELCLSAYSEKGTGTSAF